jgi:tRNA A-37 threonylcarbamoyl transferase component Bud32
LAERIRIISETTSVLIRRIPRNMLPPEFGDSALLPRPKAEAERQVLNIMVASSKEEVTQYTQALIELKKILDNALDLVKSFNTKSWTQKIIFAGMQKDKFDDIYAGLEQNMQQAALGFLVQDVLDKEKAEQARKEDCDYLLSRLEEIHQINQLIKGELDELSLNEKEWHEVHEMQINSLRMCIERYFSPVEKQPKPPISQKLLVPFCDLIIGEVIDDKSSFGRVYRGFWLGQEVVIKLIKNISSESDRKEFLNEVKSMKRLRSEYVMPLYAVCNEEGHECLVMKYMEQGSLRAVLDDKTIKLDDARKHQLAIDIALGLQYLHKQGILHRDLKSANVLLDKDMRARITDFGLSKIKSNSISTLGRYTQDLQWVAPEFLSKKMFSEQSDIYSYGVILWEIMTGQKPYADCGNDIGKLTQRIIKGTHEDIPDGIPSIYQDIIRECWSYDRHARPSLGNVIARLRSYAPKAVLQASGSSASAFFQPAKPNTGLQEKGEKSFSPEVYYEVALQFEDRGYHYDAVYYYQHAAKSGHAGSTAKLGVYYLRGAGGVVTDKLQAHQLLQEAAEKGDSLGMRNLAIQLENGDGVPLNLDLARFWYERAAKQGDEVAMKKLEALHQAKAQHIEPAGALNLK